jgi:hypothetical protein
MDGRLVLATAVLVIAVFAAMWLSLPKPAASEAAKNPGNAAPAAGEQPAMQGPSGNGLGVPSAGQFGLQASAGPGDADPDLAAIDADLAELDSMMADLEGIDSGLALEEAGLDI